PGGLTALLASGARNLAVRCLRQGGCWHREALEGQHAANLVGLEASHDGRTVVYGYSTASAPTQWYAAVLEGARLGPPLAITALNPGFEKKPLPRSEVVRWRGARDEEVEGILAYPQDYHPGQRYPLVVSIHGGPAGVDLDAWADSWTFPRSLLTGRGAFV